MMYLLIILFIIILIICILLYVNTIHRYYVIHRRPIATLQLNILPVTASSHWLTRSPSTLILSYRSPLGYLFKYFAGVRLIARHPSKHTQNRKSQSAKCFDVRCTPLYQLHRTITMHRMSPITSILSSIISFRAAKPKCPHQYTGKL